MMIHLPKIATNAMLLLVLSLAPPEMKFANGLTAAECETIFTNGFADVLSCYADNPCTCFNCDASDDTSDVFDSSSGMLPSCGDINDLLCPEINCCSECAKPIQDLYQCIFVNAFSFIPGSSLENCELDCSGYPFVDEVDPTCDPDDFQCLDLYTEYFQCYAQCNPADGCTGSFFNNGDAASEGQLQQAIQDAAIQGDDCAVANAYICPADGSAIDGCCPDCGEKLANFYQCQVNLDFDTPCTIDCANAEASSTTTPVGNNPADDPPSGAATDPPSDAATDPPSGAYPRAISHGSTLVALLLTVVVLDHSN
mmetsp:Transcript_23769/g.56118  ORF Transcript_23769/g.56118 Transcript_23769/m.56118 type:complete len:311 (+) Transcript_23769:139-1071(+)|eukprot:CAMPEP_0113470582 /NCGR_PEP_ID=MMETSP0014_2-20120614/16521_1 /TAXON_ID=2857 /ORGANISM="Nitzschia sp." /LENGTH=310 /DNA_ID=CAMNT_0000363159 /DNA_START=101 /DNA_END=1033 /DNA_ORIENTATION=+ /assembly_acc=CAM_ASM_000159